MPTGELTEEFTTFIEALRVNAGTVAGAALNLQLRTWMMPPTWTGDPLDVDATGEAFTRETTGDLYGQTLNSSFGSVGDAASLKLQSDYIASQERAFRLRHLSPVRARLHAGARRAGHSDESRGVFARVQSYVQDLLVAGGSKFVPGE